jgi:hypothetical protein
VLIEDGVDYVNKSGKSCTAVSIPDCGTPKVHDTINPCSVCSFSAHWLTRI